MQLHRFSSVFARLALVATLMCYMTLMGHAQSTATEHTHDPSAASSSFTIFGFDLHWLFSALSRCPCSACGVDPTQLAEAVLNNQGQDETLVVMELTLERTI